MSDQASVPVVETFSTQALERHIKSKTLNNPLTLFPPIFGVVGIGTALILGYGAVSMLAVAGYVSVFLGASSFMADKLFRRDSYWHDYIRKYNQKLKQQAAEMERYLEPQFRKKEMDICAEQVLKLRRFYQNFKTILDEKFFEDTSIHDRYLGVAEGLYVGALGKLQLILSKYRSVEAIDRNYIYNRLEEFEGNCDANKDIGSLCSRLELKDKTDEEVYDLIQEVEAAISGLADLSAKVAAITDASKDESFDKIQAEAIKLAKDTHLFKSEKQL